MNNDTSSPVSSNLFKTKLEAETVISNMLKAMGSGAPKKGLGLMPIYDRGGMVEQDGFAFIHAKEGVLTAEQTSTLRNEILGHRNDSLLSLLTDFREAWADTNNAYGSITKDSSVIIERAEVNMNVEKIDNDYDAQRAGEEALSRMLQIARKTQAQNRLH